MSDHTWRGPGRPTTEAGRAARHTQALPHLRAWRQFRGWSTRELALRCGVAARNINRLENDKQRARAETVCRLADALGIAPRVLLTRKPPARVELREEDDDNG